MKEEGFAFEFGYYYAVGLVIFAIVIFYSVHFPPVCFAGLLYFNCKVTSRPIWSVSASCPRLSRWPRIIAYDMCSTMILQHFVDKYNLLYVYPVNGSQHVRSGGQMGGTVHDLVLFSLCLMQYVTASVICDVLSVCDDARGGR
jgi:hypothetical protein